MHPLRAIIAQSPVGRPTSRVMRSSNRIDLSITQSARSLLILKSKSSYMVAAIEQKKLAANIQTNQ